VHYRLQARSDARPAEDEPEKHIHVDMDATMRDTTVDVGTATCDVNDDGEGTFTFNSGALDDVSDLDSARVLVAECSNLDGQTLYGRVEAGSSKSTVTGTTMQREVNTSWKTEMEKLKAAFTRYSMQTYAGPTPIENSRHLDYMKAMDKDPNEMYTRLNSEFGRTAPANNLRRQQTAARRLGTETVSTGATSLYNCESVSLNLYDRGCADYSSEKLTIADDITITYGSSSYDVTLSCVDCAATIEGASLFASVESDFGIDVEGLTDLVDDAITVIDDTADDIIETIDDTWDDVSDTAGDVVDDVGDTAGDVIDGAGDVVDDVGDTAGDVIDDAGDAWDDFTGGWRQLQQQKRRHRRRLQREEEKRRLQTVEVTAEVDFAFGASLDGLAVDFSLLMELMVSASVASSPAKYTLFSVFVPNLGIGATVAGIDLGAGLRAVANVDPELSLQGPITAQVGSKLVLDGGFAFAGSADLSSLDMSESTGTFSVSKVLDTPRFTATTSAAFSMEFALELQCGLWADVVSGTGASFYAAIGVPLIVEGTVAATSSGLLTSIPDAYCPSDPDTSSNFFVGDCTQPNNLQAQVSVYSEDVYGRLYAGASFGISQYGYSYTKTMAYADSMDQSDVTGFGLDVGPYTITYCDCIQYPGMDCSIQDSGSQCAVDSFPPASERVAPQYTEDSPPSGMAMAWEQESIGTIDGALPPIEIMAAIVVGCLVAITIIVLGLYYGLKKKPTRGHKVRQIMKKYGAKKSTNPTTTARPAGVQGKPARKGAKKKPTKKKKKSAIVSVSRGGNSKTPPRQ